MLKLKRLLSSFKAMVWRRENRGLMVLIDGTSSALVNVVVLDVSCAERRQYAGGSLKSRSVVNLFHPAHEAGSAMQHRPSFRAHRRGPEECLG